MSDDCIGNREEAIARFRYEQQQHAATRAKLATSVADAERLRAMEPSDEECDAILECVEAAALDDSVKVSRRMVVRRWLARVAAAKAGTE